MNMQYVKMWCILAYSYSTYPILHITYCIFIFYISHIHTWHIDILHIYISHILLFFFFKSHTYRCMYYQSHVYHITDDIYVDYHTCRYYGWHMSITCHTWRPYYYHIYVNYHVCRYVHNHSWHIWSMTYLDYDMCTCHHICLSLITYVTHVCLPYPYVKITNHTCHTLLVCRCINMSDRNRCINVSHTTHQTCHQTCHICRPSVYQHSCATNCHTPNRCETTATHPTVVIPQRHNNITSTHADYAYTRRLLKIARSHTLTHTHVCVPAELRH